MPMSERSGKSPFLTHCSLPNEGPLTGRNSLGQETLDVVVSEGLLQGYHFPYDQREAVGVCRLVSW